MKLRAIMLSLLALASVACPARAEDTADYPSKKIKMLLPFGAGGGGDVLGRLLADQLDELLGRHQTRVDGVAQDAFGAVAGRGRDALDRPLAARGVT